MFFSIVVPYHNAEANLRECICSVCAQTHNEWELLLVNDASTDSSMYICNEFKETFGNKIRLLSCQAGGPLIARRVGYAKAQGDVIISLDSDDMLRYDALDILEAAFEQSGADMVIFNCSRKKDFSGPNPLDPFPFDMLFSANEKLQCIRKLCSSYALNSMCTKAVRRKHIDVEADYSQWIGLKYAEDLLQSMPIMESVNSIYFTQERLYYYRVNYSGSTKKFNSIQLEMRDAVNVVQQDYALRWQIEFDDDALIDRVLALGLSSYGDMAQGACEEMCYLHAAQFMQSLVDREQFSIYWSSRRLSDLRMDMRFLVTMLKKRHFKVIWISSRFKRALRKHLGR